MAFQNDGWIKVQKIEDISDDKNTICCVEPLDIFLGKSESSIMTTFSGAFNKPVFDGITILLEISKKNDKYRYLYIGGNIVHSFLTTDKIDKYISNMNNNLIPYSIATGEENIYFRTPDFKFIKILKIFNRWKEMKVSLICLITMIQIVEKSRLKD